MSRLLILLLGLILFLLFGYWCVYEKAAPTIQNDIKDRVLNALDKGGYSTLDISIDGRDVTLSGSVEEKTQRGDVERISMVKGVRLIENQILVNKKAVQTPYFLNVEKNAANHLNLKGFVPDALTHHNFVSYLMETFDTTSIEDHLIEQTDPPDNWTSLSRLGLDALVQTQAGVLNISNDELRLTGNVSSEETRQQIISALTKQLPKNIKTTTRLDIEQTQSLNVKEMDSKETHKMTAIACQDELDKALSGTKIIFNISSSKINSSSYPVLEKIAEIKAKCPALTLHIVGHTDSVGNENFNLQLSKKRAQSVKEYFSTAGINNNNMIAEGVGSTQPIADNRTKKGRNKNRRIEMSIEEL